MTADIDVTVEVDRTRLAEIVVALAAAGFQVRVPDVDDSVARTSVVPLVHQAAGVPIDMVVAGSRRPVDGQLLAGRPKDVEDAVALLQAVPEIDVDGVAELVILLEQALGQSDLTPLPRQVVARARSVPRPRA